MTFNQLEILKYSSAYYGVDNPITIEDTIVIAKDLLGENYPYSVQQNIDGDDIIVFRPHFQEMLRIAISDGCIDRMSIYERTFWFEYLAYAADITDGVRDDLYIDISMVQSPIVERELAYQALVDWLKDELTGVEHPENPACGDPYTAPPGVPTVYYGASNIGATDLAGLTEVIGSISSTHTFTSNANVFYFCFLDEFTDLTSIKDTNGFEVIGDWTKRIVAVSGENYKFYEFNNVTSVTTDFTFVQ